MKTLLVVCLVLTATVLGKESVSDLVSLLEDPDVLQEIVKRLGQDGPVPVEKSETESSIGDSCQYKNFSNTIIQTKASTAAGAAFLDSVNGLASKFDCIKRCCELDGCELAVYENKDDRNCYLFRCKDPDTNKNYCEFASLDGYISSSITHDIKTENIFQTSSNSDHENDLQDLSESGKLVNVPATTSTTTTTTTTTTETPEEPHSVSIGGVCKTNAGCEDSHSFCLNGICTCLTSYYNKHGTCREVCGHSRFECKVVDLDGPDCIRNSIVCDGKNDCHDGSDERNCQTGAPLNRYPHWFQNQFGSRFHSQFRHQDYGTLAPEKNIPPTAETSVDAAGMAREFHESHPMESSEDLDSAIKEMKKINPDSKPETTSLEESANTIQSKDQDENIKLVAVTPKPNPNPVVVWPDSSSNDDIVVPQRPQQEPEKLVPTSNYNQHPYQKEIPMDSFIPDRMISSQGKKGPSYFLANKPQVPKPQPTQKTEVDIVPKPKLTKTQSPHPVHDAHMISDPDSSSEDNQPNLPFPGRKYPKNQLPLNQPGFENYYQPPFRHQQQYPPDLTLADPDERQGDITPFNNRNYPPYNRPQQSFPPYNNQLNYQNRQPPSRNPFTPEHYGKNFMYDYPDYESYQPDDSERSSQEHPAYIPVPGLYHRFNSFSQDDDKSSKPADTKIHSHHTELHDKDIKQPPTSVKNVKELPVHPETDPKDSPTDSQQNIPDEDIVQTSDEGIKSTEMIDESNPKESNPKESNPDGSKSNPEDSKQSTDSSEANEDQTKNTPENTDTGSNEESEKGSDLTVEETESLLVRKEKMKVNSSIQTAQGPIIALSLGLAFTFMLLVFIGCRLRNMKRRLRKGRVLHSNEADYLINGMYL